METIQINRQDAETLLLALQPLPPHIKGGALRDLLDTMNRVGTTVSAATPVKG